MRLRWDLHDRYDRATRTASMARTTGYTCTAVVRLWASGRLRQTGVVPLELLGQEEGVAAWILADLAERNVRFEEREEVLPGA
ncbi:MAG: hypothetical protein AB2L07_19750 [Thermoanaerobaculaceae bacterium]